MRSSCGRMDGQDYATKNDSLIQDKDFKKAINGDPLAPKLMEFQRNRPEKYYAAYYFGYPAQQCNAEFRERFKSFLVSRHSVDELGRIWSFLKPRNRVFQPTSLLPMREFYNDDRKPPANWAYAVGETSLSQLQKWDAKKVGDGPKLRSTLGEFWAMHRSTLDDSWAVSPSAMTDWKPAKDPSYQRIIARINGKAG